MRTVTSLCCPSRLRERNTLRGRHLLVIGVTALHLLAVSHVGNAQGLPPPTINYRSIGIYPGPLVATGTASVIAGSSVVTFAGVSLPATVGRGDMLVLDPGGPQEEVLFLFARDTGAQVTVQSPSVAGHSIASFLIARAFTAIQDWEDGREGDLVAENRVEVGVLYDDGPFTLPNANRIAKIKGSITDDAHFLWLTVAAGHRHEAVAGAGVLLDGGSTTKHGLRIRSDYTRVDGLQFKAFRGYNGATAIEVQEAVGVLLEDLLIYDFYDPESSVVGIKGQEESDFTVRNTIIYDGDTAGIRLREEGGLALVQNCTIFNMGGRGIYEDDGVIYGREHHCRRQQQAQLEESGRHLHRERIPVLQHLVR